MSVKRKLMASYPVAFVQADVNGTAELHVVAVGKFESAEFGRQEVPVDCVEVFE